MLVRGMLLLALSLLWFEFAVVEERIRERDGMTLGLLCCHEPMAAVAGREILRWVLKCYGPQRHKIEVC
jgi:hypothetical protein